MDDILVEIRRTLADNTDEKTRATSQNYFKEKIKYYGVKVPIVNKIGKHFFDLIKDKPKNEIFGLCEELWKSEFIEESFIACNWSYYIHHSFETEDITVFKRWINNYVGNWASCDTLCNHTVGIFLEKYPEYVSELKNWALSDNRWMKRAAAVTFVIPARKGMFLKDILEIADILLLDKDDLVQKGYGWMLKAASETHQKEIFDYVVSKKTVMPRTALRYAIEKMPQELRKEAMKK